jgi:predicted 3-demethylubiquinone-9 3-methyltransferase (glyoxalase superfamily)
LTVASHLIRDVGSLCQGQGGDEKAQQCGWLKDEYGLSWQVVPRVLLEMLNDRDAAKSELVMSAMLQMKKIDVSELERAYRGGS